MSGRAAYEIASRSDQGKRERQEDAAGFTDPDDKRTYEIGVLAVLADGMGGLTAGAMASQLVVRTFRDTYWAKDPKESIPQALRRAAEQADKAVLREAQRLGRAGGVGSTLVAAVLDKFELHWISAGDSRAYLCRDGSLHRLTVDHNVGEDRWHSPESVEPDAHAAALTSFIGRTGALRTDGNLRPLRVRSDDCVVLASDGLYDALGEARIAQHLTGNLQEGCDRMIRLAVGLDLPEQDNLTIMAMRVQDAPEE